MSPGKRTPKHVRLDERNHVKKPLLDQLAGLGWEVLDLEMKQYPPTPSGRTSQRL